MEEKARTQRTVGVTEGLTNGQRVRLAELYSSDTWPVILDVWEQALIEMESAFIRVSVADEKAVLAHHRKLQAGWEIFEGMQRRVYEECVKLSQATAERMPTASPEDADLLSIVEPFNDQPPDRDSL